jgi:3-oxoacyl-[acyl-carrier protein] reductase
MNLSGAVVVVTGRNGAMGPHIMKKLAGLGAQPVAWDVYVEGTDKPTVFCDVGNVASVADAIARTEADWGVPTALVTAAAISGGFSPLAATAAGDDWEGVLTAPEDWARVLTTNVIGVANCMRVFARRLACDGREGAIVNVSSIGAGPVAEPGLAAYAASKAAINQLTRVAAADLGPLGIRVNAVGVGVMAAPMLGPRRGSGAIKVSDARPQDFVQDVCRYVPIEQRHGTGDDIAEAVCALLQLRWVTGQVLYADGGLTLRSPVTT